MASTGCRVLSLLNQRLHCLSLSGKFCVTTCSSPRHHTVAPKNSIKASQTGYHPALVSSRVGDQSVQGFSPLNRLIGNHIILHPCLVPSLKTLPFSLPVNQSVTDMHNWPKISYDCPAIPTTGNQVEIPPQSDHIIPIECPVLEQIEKTGPGIENVVKQARRIQKIRHEKMKKHQRKKYKEKNLAILRQIRHKRARAKERKLVWHLEKYKKMGEKFDPKELLLEELALARSRGFSVNVLDSFKNQKDSNSK